MVRAWFPAKAVALRIIATIRRSVAIGRSGHSAAHGYSVTIRNNVARACNGIALIHSIVTMGCVPSWFYVSIERGIAIGRSRRGVAIGRSIAMRNNVAKSVAFPFRAPFLHTSVAIRHYAYTLFRVHFQI